MKRTLKNTGIKTNESTARLMRNAVIYKLIL